MSDRALSCGLLGGVIECINIVYGVLEFNWPKEHQKSKSLAKFFD
jgi:hypothetical protein